MRHHDTDPLSVTVLIVNDEAHQETAAGRAIRALAAALGEFQARVITAASEIDARALIAADASLHAAIVDWDLGATEDHVQAASVLTAIRARNAAMPVFLLAERTRLMEIPLAAIQQANDFIWLLEDSVEFIAGRIIAAISRYQDQMLPPMLRSLLQFSRIHEYSWHTPGHTGGTGFLKSPVGRMFYSFFGENLLRADLSISVGELGSLLDHSGPIGAGEANAARVFGADRTYFVTNGTSTSNRVVVMATVARDQIALCDRNCHKSIEHAMTMSAARPVYLLPSRNHLGIIGPVHPDRLDAAATRASIAANRLASGAGDTRPALAILTNSTYDGLCYNVDHVESLLGESVDRILFDEAWFAYARFHPLYAGRYGMRDRQTPTREPPGASIFATQSTHKLLNALSQASMIHVRHGRGAVAHERFNETFMMHASTSPQYAIIASNDVSTAMMDGASGTALIDEAILEAIAFRQMMARLGAEFAAKDTWFFSVWQPDTVLDEAGKTVAFQDTNSDHLAREPQCWHLAPDAAWHGFGNLEDGYCMLDPIKVSVVTPCLANGGGSATPAIPAPIVSAYLDQQGVIVEKTTDFTILVLFSLGVTKGKWGTLVNALLDFKRDHDANVPLARVLPKLVDDHPTRYGELGLHDLADAMAAAGRTLDVSACLEAAFSTLPIPDCTPSQAYDRVVRDAVEAVPLAEMSGRTLATGVVPYPPGIPLLMPGENAGTTDGVALRYLTALESFDRLFPGFGHDIHGIECRDGTYHALCIT